MKPKTEQSHTPEALEYKEGTAPHYQGQVYGVESGRTFAITYDDIEGESARLIAAAPDLLDSLEGLLSYVESHCGVPMFTTEIDAARAAIQKAMGEGQ